MFSAPMLKSESVWLPYRPDAKAPWNLERVVHLHRRTGFGATWKELQRDLSDGVEPTTLRLLNSRSRITRMRLSNDRTGDALAAAAAGTEEIQRLEASWIYRMMLSKDPLRERLTLMWHNHFATSQLKVLDVKAMKNQNDVLRAKALGPFEALLTSMMQDAAMLEWLDAASNYKKHPNENLARELMELFTLGIENYSELDVKEAARALTGWTLRNGQVQFVSVRHDPGLKTILGQKDKFDKPKLLALLLAEAATPRRLAWRLCKQFMSEGAVAESGIAELAVFLKANGLHIGKAVALILRSRAFFAPANIRSRVSEPVAHAVACVRALELFDSVFSTVSLAESAARLGQQLFFPPNVGGWKGGRSWLSTRHIIGRVNFAQALCDGRIGSEPSPFDVIGLARSHGRAKDMPDVVNFLCELLMGVDAKRVGIAVKSYGTRLDNDVARRALAKIMAFVPMQLA